MAALIEPDLEFKRAILGLDAPDLTACYQCGTCSAVCPLSTPDNPFPRKEMAWVNWGLKERVLSNASIWLCHQCAECSAYCPRGAGPASVMAALRDFSVRHYAAPAFMGRALGAPRHLLLLFGAPVVLLLLLLAGLGHLDGLPAGRIVFAKFIPDGWVEVIYSLAVGLALAAAAWSGLRYLNAMQQAGQGRVGAAELAGAVVATLRAIFSQRNFKDCTRKRPGLRKTYREHAHRAHLALFYGFLGLVITTTSVAVGMYVFDYQEPWPLWHPVKILGNASGAVLIAGLAVFSWRRAADAARAGKSTYTDWLLLTVLALTALTGFACEATRLAGLRQVAYPTYFVHLVLVFFLLVYFPYTKFSHVVYRSAAMLYSAAIAARLPAARAAQAGLPAADSARSLPAA